MGKYSQIYKDISRIPEVKSGSILAVNKSSCSREKDDLKILVHWQCRDLVDLRQQSTDSVYLLSGNQITSSPSEILPSNVILECASPNGSKKARIIKTETEGNGKLVVSYGDGDIVCIDLNKEQLHGKVYCDPYISCLDWSWDETKLAFIAEEIRANRPAGEEDDGIGETNLYLEDWGEQMRNQHQGVVVIIDLSTEESKVILLPGDATPGQLIWRPHSEDLVGVAYPSKPYRIGIAYCSDRESFLFVLDKNRAYSEITSRGQHVKSPRFSSSGGKLSFLQSTIYGERAPAAQLAVMDWQHKKVTVVLDYVNVPQDITNGKEFPGVCGKTILPKRCFDEDEKYVIFSAYKICNYVTYLVNLDSKNVWELTNSNEYTAVLDYYRNWILFLKSSLTEPDRVYVSKLSMGKNRPMQLTPISKHRSLKYIDKDWLQVWRSTSPEKDKEGKYIVLSSLYVGPTDTTATELSKRPLICVPHGGPHSVIGNRFSHSLAFFVSIGYSLILPNYRGSVGHGNEFLTACLGQCGREDVLDCLQSVQECKEKYGNILDPEQTFLIGFSHGGFLAFHMASQHPESFKAIAALNPASDIYIMAAVSDIPEWAFLEFGLPFTLGRSFDIEAVTHMFNRSPISLVDQMKTPTLFLLGKEDVRVPPCQGINYYKMLLARNVPTRLYMYEDDHPLRKISSESDYVIRIANWFDLYKGENCYKDE